ncbi:MAG: flagellar basal body-associated FliL family protein [Alphaproteobacteria bacterium]|nr:flagellar basal body-associated FliL family protein [Alphaproteobacteria bacterium]
MARAEAVAVADASDAEDAAAGGKKRGKGRLLLLLAVPLLLGGAGAGLWFTGILPPLLGMGGHEPAQAEAGAAAGPAGARAAAQPVFVDLPEMIVNLNTGGRRPSYLKLRAKLEVSSSAEAEAVQRAMPRLVDLFQTYLRELRPEELRGSIGTWRLREELLARANLALAPARAADVLFQDMLVQ